MGSQQSVTGPRVHALPKVELHVHLEGSISARRARALAERHGPAARAALRLDRGEYPGRYRDFEHFLGTFLAASGQVRTPEDLHDVAAAFVREQQRQRVAYTEVTVTAASLVDAGLEPRAMWAALRAGLAAAPAVRVGLIVDVVRDEGPRAAERTVRLVEDADAPIVGLGLSGRETAVPEGAFRVLRTAADRLGLGLTVHAGETGAATNVAAAVEELGADRIGHGIAVLDDPAVTRRMAAAGVPLEVCPSSNVALGLVDSLAAHPLPRLRAAGLAVTVNSDDPPFFATTLTDELGHAARLLGGNGGTLADLQITAARVAFAPAAVRDALVAAVERWRDDADSPADPR